MNYIDQELISNKQILSFENLGDMECETVLLSVTRGMASHEQKQYCYQQYWKGPSASPYLCYGKYFIKLLLSCHL